MPAMVCLLRGVNLGSRRMKMENLRAMFASLGYADARTHLQSGNVVFHRAERDISGLRAGIERAVERAFGFEAAVVLRTAAEMRGVAAANPFAGRGGFDLAKLLVTFLDAAPAPGAIRHAAEIHCAPDEFVVAGREIYCYLPHGAGRATLPWAKLAKTLGQEGTSRNWNTVLALEHMAAEMEKHIS